MNGRSSVALATGESLVDSARDSGGGLDADSIASCGAIRGEARASAVPVRGVRPGSPAVPVVRRPAGPGRVPSRSVRRAPVRPVPAGRLCLTAGAPARVVVGRMRPAQCSAARRTAGWRPVAGLLVAAIASGAAVFGLGALADLMAQVRVPDATGPVVVRADETLLQLAHRAAPSADPTAVVRRIVILNDLRSPSVQPGQILVSPIE